MKYIVELTPSERMALLDVINQYMLAATGIMPVGTLTTNFIDCSQVPEITTHVGDLLVKVMDAAGVHGEATPGDRQRRPITPIPDAT